VSLALAFPDVYEVGCSNLGLTILYRRAARLGWVRVERAFAPWPDYAAALERTGRQLCSRETATALGRFDVVGFSLQHELTYTTVLWMLRLAAIPLRSADRTSAHPLVVAGGPGATNPEPMADFVDAFAAGDGEEILPRILAAVREARGRGRRGLLERLAALGHVYVPSLLAREGRVRRVVTDADGSAPARVPIAPPAPLGRDPVDLQVVPAVETVFDRAQVEIARGCSGGCRFCHAGMVYRPVRERSPGRVVEDAVRQLIATGYDELSLSSLSTADYPALGQAVRALAPILERRRIALSVASLRAYGLETSVLEAIHAVRATGMTLAPEAGSERLRARVNKTVTREDLLSALERMHRQGWQKVKLYFMMGLPGERDEDLEALCDLVASAARLWHRPRGRGKHRLSVSISNFVPKPFTPFEREAMLDPGELEARARRIRHLASGTGARIAFHDPWQSWIEGLLARGGQELGDLLEAALEAGCRLDGWGEQFDAAAWRGAMDATHVRPSDYAQAIPDERRVPWDVLAIHVEEGFLAGERQLAREGTPRQRCDSPVGETCHDCGAPCDPDQAALARGDDVADGRALALEELARAEDGNEDVWGGGGDDADRRFVHLCFDRVRAAAYLGHRDVIRIVAQTMRRACVPLRYSEGFTPRPRLVFRAALPVGVIGFGEEVTAEVTRPLVDAEGLIARLAPVAPDGICFTSARSLEARQARQVGRGPSRILWMLPVGTPGDAGEALDDILARESILRRRISGKREVTVDLRPLIATARLGSAGEVDDLRDPGLAPDSGVVLVEARPVDGRWIRPSELLALLSERGVRASWVARRIFTGTEEP
jgi:radical SAM family uncharacterized protein/radical SAM-linked protein